MRWLHQQFFSQQFLRFLLTGGLAAAVNYGSRFLYSVYFDFNTAVILAYLSGMATAYLLFRRKVFVANGGATHREVSYFVLVNLLGLAQTWVISMVLANHVFPGMLPENLGEAVAHLVGVLFPVFTSFIGHKYLTFRE